MDRLILPFVCSGQKIKKKEETPFKGIKPGSRNYIFVSCEFENNPDKKLISLKNDNYEEAYELTDELFLVPDMFCDSSFKVTACWVKDDKKVITNSIRVSIR